MNALTNRRVSHMQWRRRKSNMPVVLVQEKEDVGRKQRKKSWTNEAER